MMSYALLCEQCLKNLEIDGRMEVVSPGEIESLGACRGCGYRGQARYPATTEEIVEARKIAIRKDLFDK